MMIKVIPPGSYDFSDRMVSHIKVASHGLKGYDLQQLIKVAGHSFATEIKKIASTFEPGEVPVLMSAMGSTERFGPNRNHDGFRADMLKEYHPTFVKHARFYRDHRNRQPEKSYGIVKLSSFNDNIGRVELLSILNGNKAIAEKNGGLVADKELEKLAKDEEIPVSMSIKVPYDVCTGCGNKAKNRSEYCEGTHEGGHCKYGGLKHNIGRVDASGLVVHADNPKGKFFDISHVFRPADRTAYVFGKVASTNDVAPSGAELAEILQVSASPDILMDDPDYSENILFQLKIASMLSDMESNYRPSDLDYAFSKSASISDINLYTQEQRPFALRALADSKISLSFNDWLRLVTGASDEKCASATAQVMSVLPNVFAALANSNDLADLLQANPCKASYTTTYTLQKWASDHAQSLSLENKNVLKRLWSARLHQMDKPSTTTVKSASVSDTANRLAQQYALYQIGLLSEFGSSVSDVQHYADLIIRQNRVAGAI